jgi:hypothetical protein
MRSDIGRYFSGRLLPTIKLLQALFDVGTGAGYDVDCWIDGREMVFGRGEPGEGQGFLRVTPLEATVILSFPNGDRLFDPRKRGSGPPNSQKRIMIGHPSEIDFYVRRLIEEAYELDDSGF